MATQIPEAVRCLIDFGPYVCLVVILVKGVLTAGAKHVLLHHDLCGSYKQVQLALQQHGLYIRACGLVEGQISLTAPRVLLDVVDLHGEGALVVPTDACNVVDAVLMQGSQTLTPRDTHRGKMTPIVLPRIEAEEIFTLKDIDAVPVLHCAVKLHGHWHRTDCCPTVVPGIIALY